MLVGIMGKMGSGKTLSMTALATFLYKTTQIPLYSNYSLKDAKPVSSLAEIWQLDNAILCFDEIWLSMDARLWKDNVLLTRWVNQTRKKKLLVFYTTQHIRQVELRVRNATDVLIYCERTSEGIWLNFIDYQYRKLGRRYLMSEPQNFFKLYNTYEVVNPIKMS